MKCPNCKSDLVQVTVGDVVVDHCNSCGGTFLDENEINLLSSKYARTLARMKKTDVISAEEKLCPRDHTPLKSLISEAKPQHITLLQCDRCHGIFAFADDLLEFKKAQEVKVDYLKKWNIPVPKLSTVLVYSLALIVGLSLYASTTLLQQDQSTKISAEEVMSNVEIISSDADTTICFTTKEEVLSVVTFMNTVSGETIEQTLSDIPSRLHCRTFSNSEFTDVGDAIEYSITITAPEGEVFESPFTPLSP